MPRNKEALIRYRVINRCLLECSNATLIQLKQACEKALDIYPIGERTIEADIRAMRYDTGLGYNAPIRMDRTRGVYYYEDPNYSIDSIPLNEDELESLVFAARLLEQYRNVEIFKTFTGSIQKLVNTINVYRLEDENTVRNFIEFDIVEAAKGTEYLETLIRAIKEKQVIRVEYMSFTIKNKTINIIHPYHLKEYRNRWFLIGYNEKYSGIRTYGLERIIGINVESGIRFKDNGFDAKMYYENVLGISVLNKKPVEIHIGFSELQVQYIISQPVHHSQEFVKKEGKWYIYRLLLIPNYEFYAQVLSWGEEAEILTPKRIRSMYLSIINKINQNYFH